MVGQCNYLAEQHLLRGIIQRFHDAWARCGDRLGRGAHARGLTVACDRCRYVYVAACFAQHPAGQESLLAET